MQAQLATMDDATDVHSKISRLNRQIKPDDHDFGSTGEIMTNEWYKKQRRQLREERPRLGPDPARTTADYLAQYDHMGGISEGDELVWTFDGAVSTVTATVPGYENACEDGEPTVLVHFETPGHGRAYMDVYALMTDLDQGNIELVRSNNN